MDEYVKVQDVVDMITSMFDRNGADIAGYREFLAECVKKLPHYEVARVHRAHWDFQDNIKKAHFGWDICSECGYWESSPTRYCPNCGATMEGEQ